MPCLRCVPSMTMKPSMPPSAPPAEPEGDRAPVAAELQRLGREHERLYGQLLDGERRLRRLARSVWRVQEDERRRLAAELHDGLGQSLTALRIKLEHQAERATDPAAAAALQDGAVIAAQALEETRRLSHVLRPHVLDDLGLVPALRWLVRTLGEGTGVALEFEHAGIEAEDRLDGELETVLFRVAQEALTNVLKHAQTEAATVRLLRPQPAWLRLEIEDGGCGFLPAARAGTSSHGLRGMRDRVEIFGGRLEVQSSPGAGTLVVAELPIAAGGKAP